MKIPTRRKTHHAEKHLETDLVNVGREYSEHGFVNPAIYQASTRLFPSAEAIRNKYDDEFVYGRRGTPTIRALENAMIRLEKGKDALLCPSGLAAACLVLLNAAKPHAHILVVDSVYHPVRVFCDNHLKRRGVNVEYYPPSDDAKDIQNRIRKETSLVYAESPGSLVMEMQDVPALADAAKKRNVPLVLDNTWSAGIGFHAIKNGCAASIQAATKYVGGHSDLMLGTIVSDDTLAEDLRALYGDFGLCAGTLDISLALRGIRTLPSRLRRHYQSALKIAEALRRKDEIEEVFYPPLPEAPGHEIWKKNYSIGCGLMSIAFKTADPEKIDAFVNGLRLFGIGFSWGGFESLALPFDPQADRVASEWTHHGGHVRLHIGLEDPDDLLDDLAQGLERMRR